MQNYTLNWSYVVPAGHSGWSRKGRARISSESDSAALAPLQLGIRFQRGTTFHALSIIATRNPCRRAYANARHAFADATEFPPPPTSEESWIRGTIRTHPTPAPSDQLWLSGGRAEQLRRPPGRAPASSHRPTPWGVASGAPAVQETSLCAGAFRPIQLVTCPSRLKELSGSLPGARRHIRGGLSGRLTRSRGVSLCLLAQSRAKTAPESFSASRLQRGRQWAST